MVRGKNTVSEQRIVDLLLHDLAKVHEGITYEQLRELYVDHHAYNWYDNEFAIGMVINSGTLHFRFVADAMLN
jgi:6,7-dimethyl-8-ribityllumazine synthase